MNSLLFKTILEPKSSRPAAEQNFVAAHCYQPDLDVIKPLIGLNRVINGRFRLKTKEGSFHLSAKIVNKTSTEFIVDDGLKIPILSIMELRLEVVSTLS